MSLINEFLKEFDSEMATTRRVLERLPMDRLAWKPHPKSKSMGELATHVAEQPRWGLRIQGEEFAVGSEKAPQMSTIDQYLSRFDENARSGRAAIAAMSEDQLARDFTVTRGDQTFFRLKKGTMLRRTLLNHMIHHRGQLTVYLRLNDVPLPPVYGPTADEGS